MEIQLFKRNEYSYDYVIFRTRPFKFCWFKDYGEWFVYITIGKYWVRFSSVGFLKGKERPSKFSKTTKS
jgi:hypothetical protein